MRIDKRKPSLVWINDNNVRVIVFFHPSSFYTMAIILGSRMKAELIDFWGGVWFNVVLEGNIMDGY